ncbi:hypothetical protein RRG08_065275 [Elysia crispata]|uniref:Secreted protein n=1 Tax=Elysia crispata TaxID=231223 RepID=A0AAE0Z4Z1_9GAST|nr:hypothetical protein RRG08_065275 [Elysia crispata]
MSHFCRHLSCWRPYLVSLLSLFQLLKPVPCLTSVVISVMETIPCFTSVVVSDVGDYTMCNFCRHLNCWRPYHVSLLSSPQMLETIPCLTSVVILDVGDHTMSHFCCHLRYWRPCHVSLLSLS